MAFSNVQNSGLLAVTNGGDVTWTPGVGPTLNNLLSCRVWKNSLSSDITTTDVTDSSGTPKVFNGDVLKTDNTGSGNQAAIYSLVVPSGLTTPLKDTRYHNITGASLQLIFDEWAGNASSSVLDQTNLAVPASSASPVNGASINAGANAGLVLTVFSVGGNGVANDGITSTGTNFVQDAVENDSITNDAGEAAHRITSVAGNTIHDQVSWTSSGNLIPVNVIASYNAPAAAASLPLQSKQKDKWWVARWWAAFRFQFIQPQLSN